jgi:hypothetical protein
LKYAFENPILSERFGQKLRSVRPITITVNDMDDLILPVDAFIRSIGVNRSAPHALFLGAGASITSGIPSASMCIWEWKRDTFLTNNPGLEDQFSELSLPSVKERTSPHRFHIAHQISSSRSNGATAILAGSTKSR